MTAKLAVPCCFDLVLKSTRDESSLRRCIVLTSEGEKSAVIRAFERPNMHRFRATTAKQRLICFTTLHYATTLTPTASQTKLSTGIDHFVTVSALPAVLTGWAAYLQRAAFFATRVEFQLPACF